MWDTGTAGPRTPGRPEALERAARILGASLPLFRLAGIRVRLHWGFVIVALLLAGWTAAGTEAPCGVAAVVAWGFVEAAILYALVFIHELAHAGAAAARGRRAQEIVLTPLGGTAIIDEAMAGPAMEAEVALAGPGANLVFVGVSVALFARNGLPQAWGEPWSLRAAGSFAFWANVWLAVFNLLPAFPLDGGRVARAVASWRLGERAGTRLAARTGELAAFVMAGLGLWWGGIVALILFGIGVSNLLACEDAIRLLDSGLAVYEEPVPVKAGRPAPDYTREQEELERQVDELLAKVARKGLLSLSFREKRFLRRASRRYRESPPK